jgi:hypothetical protein
MQYGSGSLGRKRRANQHLVLATTGEGIWRTEGHDIIKPLGLPANETAELVHLIYPTLRPTLLPKSRHRPLGRGVRYIPG